MIRPKRTYRYTLFAKGARLITLVLLAGGSGAAIATPDYPFSGRWRIDTTSIKENAKPTLFRVGNGKFKRDDNQLLAADGHPHSIAGDGYVDETTISIESDHVVKEIDSIRGKIAYTVEYVVSDDENTLTWHVASFTSPDGQPVRNKTIMRRIGVAVKGVHLISGQWQRVSIAIDSRHDDILKLDGNTFISRSVGGSGFNAIIGGRSVPIDGDNSGARVLITRPRPDLIVEKHLSAKGKVEGIMSLQLMPDKKTIRASTRYGSDKRWTSYYMRKQED